MTYHKLMECNCSTTKVRISNQDSEQKYVVETLYNIIYCLLHITHNSHYESVPDKIVLTSLIRALIFPLEEKMRMNEI